MKRMFFAAVAATFTAFTLAVVLCVQALFLPQAVFSGAEEKMRIVIDAGHGGVDGGVVGKTTGIKESDLNLLIAFALKDALADMGFEVTLTRKTQAGLYDTAAKGFKKRDMQRRKEIIQASDPSFVLSIHQNFYPSRTTRGGQVFYKKSDENGRLFALALQTRLNALYAEENAKARNATAADFFILGCADVPSALIECGFLSSEKDEALLCSSVFREKLAGTIAAGVVDFLENMQA